MANIPNFYDRYKGKFPSIIDALAVINEFALECGLEELYLNGQKNPNCFGGCEECRNISTYQILTKNHSMQSYKTPIIIEIEEGYNYQNGGNPDYFIAFRIRAELLTNRYDEFMNFFDKCFFELTGNNYNLVLSQDFEGYINLIYVPLQRQGLIERVGTKLSSNPLIYFILTIYDNPGFNGQFKFYSNGIAHDVLDGLTPEERTFVERFRLNTPNSISELTDKLIDRLNKQRQK